MDFLLKKLVSVFFMPFSIGLILFFLGLFFLLITNNKKAKLYLSLAFLWIFVIAYSPFSNALVKPLENQYKAYLDVDPSIKYVLVLGNGHKTNEQLSATSQLSSTALFRLTEGIRIFRKLNDGTIITSGYGGSDKTPHAIKAKKAAISLGVKDENIIPMPNPRDTKEEALALKELIQDEKFILVTSATHMPRAIRIFNEEGLYPIAAPTDFLSKDEGKYQSVPNPYEMQKTQNAFHEYLGSAWQFLNQNIRNLIN